jgi:hypothetical protein
MKSASEDFQNDPSFSISKECTEYQILPKGESVYRSFIRAVLHFLDH